MGLKNRACWDTQFHNYFIQIFYIHKILSFDSTVMILSELVHWHFKASYRMQILYSNTEICTSTEFVPRYPSYGSLFRSWCYSYTKWKKKSILISCDSRGGSKVVHDPLELWIHPCKGIK